MIPSESDSTADAPDSELTDKDILDRYKMEIQLYEKEYKTWETRSQKIIKRYKDERAAPKPIPHDSTSSIVTFRHYSLLPMVMTRNLTYSVGSKMMTFWVESLRMCLSAVHRTK